MELEEKYKKRPEFSDALEKEFCRTYKRGVSESIKGGFTVKQGQKEDFSHKILEKYKTMLRREALGSHQKWVFRPKMSFEEPIRA